MNWELWQKDFVFSVRIHLKIAWIKEKKEENYYWNIVTINKNDDNLKKKTKSVLQNWSMWNWFNEFKTKQNLCINSRQVRNFLQTCDFFPHCQYTYSKQCGITFGNRRGKQWFPCEKQNSIMSKNSTLRRKSPNIFHIYSVHLIGSWRDKSVIYHLHYFCKPCLAKSVNKTCYNIGSVASDV